MVVGRVRVELAIADGLIAQSERSDMGRRRHRARAHRVYNFADGDTLWGRASRAVQAWQGHIDRSPLSTAAVALGWRYVSSWRTLQSLATGSFGGVGSAPGRIGRYCRVASSRIDTAPVGPRWRWCERTGGSGRPIGYSGAAPLSRELLRQAGRADPLQWHAACVQGVASG